MRATYTKERLSATFSKTLSSMNKQTIENTFGDVEEKFYL